MTYQIPQKLQYREKIMFGLDFKQLAYAFGFGLISLIFFKSIDNLFIKYTLIFFSSGTGICFMFLNLENYIKDYWIFLKFQKVKKDNPTMEKLVGIRAIENNVIINSKGKKISLLKINSINFSLKQKTEQDAIICAFQKFLNSLDFPTQILMNTENLDLKDYLQTLESHISGEKFEEIFKSYKDYIQGTIKDNKIMNRVFYIIIPEKEDIEIQTEICIERIRALNLKVERLKTRDIRKLLINFFSGSGNEEGINSLFPEYVNNSPDNLDINGKFHRVIYAYGYPRTVESGFLDKIVSSLADFNLSIHINPYPIDRMLIDLNRELQKQQADLYALKNKGIFNPSLEIQYGDTRGTLENLQKGQERLFNVSLYIDCKANSLRDLDLLTKKVESELNSIMIVPKIARFRMLQGFRSTAPLGEDELKNTRNITTDALSAFFPFTSQFLQVDNSGIWLGLNKNNIPIIKDIFKLPNPNGVVLAQSGGGKSYFCKLLITRYLLNGTKVIIIDPQGEYKSLVNYFGGQIIDLSRKSKTLINPLDLMGHDYTEKRLSLMDLFPVMLGDLSEPQKAFLDKALTETYRSKGITIQSDSLRNKPPVLSDLLFQLNKFLRKATQVEKTSLRSLINRLDMYVSGVFGFLNKQTKINFNSDLVCFDIGAMPKQVKPAIMFLVLDYVYMKMKSDINRKILLIDEAWSLLSRTEEASYIFEIVKTCRKFNMGLLLINQEVEDLFNSRAGKSVLANSAYNLLLRQKPSVIKNICDAFHLSPSERDHLLTASVGEGLLLMEDEHSKIKVLASPQEHKIITTNADEILVQKKGTKKKEINMNIDLEKRFYRRKELNRDEIEFLLTQGYQKFSQKSLLSNKKEEFLLNPRHNESLGHMFMVYDIAQFLEKKGIKVEMFTTKMPDIMFELKGKKYAVEVETGTVADHLDRINEKINILNKHSNKWFFVVTNKKIVQRYRRFGETVDPRFLKNYLNRLLKS